MQKAIMVNNACGSGDSVVSCLNNYLSDGWKVLQMEQFCPNIGGNSNTYTLGAILVIVEKE